MRPGAYIYSVTSRQAAALHSLVLESPGGPQTENDTVMSESDTVTIAYVSPPLVDVAQLTVIQRHGSDWVGEVDGKHCDDHTTRGALISVPAVRQSH